MGSGMSSKSGNAQSARSGVFKSAAQSTLSSDEKRSAKSQATGAAAGRSVAVSGASSSNIAANRTQPVTIPPPRGKPAPSAAAAKTAAVTELQTQPKLPAEAKKTPDSKTRTATNTSTSAVQTQTPITPPPVVRGEVTWLLWDSQSLVIRQIAENIGPAYLPSVLVSIVLAYAKPDHPATLFKDFKRFAPCQNFELCPLHTDKATMRDRSVHWHCPDPTKPLSGVCSADYRSENELFEHWREIHRAEARADCKHDGPTHSVDDAEWVLKGTIETSVYCSMCGTCIRTYRTRYS